MKVTKELKDYISSIVEAKYSVAEREISRAESELAEKVYKDVSEFYEEADRKREEYMKEHGLTLERYSSGRYPTYYGDDRKPTPFTVPVSIELRNRRKEISEKRDKYMLQILVTLSAGIEDKTQLDKLLNDVVF